MSNRWISTLTLFVIVAACAGVSCFAATPGGASSPYSIQTDTLDAGGSTSANGVYTQSGGSIGQFVVDVAAVSPYSVQHGYVGQLSSFTPPQINPNPYPNQIVQENAVSVALPPFTIADVETAATSLTIGAASDNQTVMPNGGLNFTGTTATRTLSVTPASNQFGVANITVTVTDGEGGTTTRTFMLTVNAPPVIAQHGPQACTPGSVTDLTNSTLLTNDPDNSAAQLTYTLTANPTQGNLKKYTSAFGGGASSPIDSGVGHTFTQADVNNNLIRYQSTGGGADSFTFTVSDGSFTTTQSNFNIAVGTNTPPTISAFGNPAPIAINTATAALPFTVGDAQTAPGALLVSAASGNSTLLPQATNYMFGGMGTPNRTIKVTPAANQFGTAVVTITVTDGDLGTNSASFNLGVNPAPLSINANSSISLPFNIDSTQTTVTGTSNNQLVIADTSITLSGSSQNRNLTIAAGTQPGSATLTLTITGTGSPVTLTLPVTVTTVKTLVVKNINDSGADSLRDCMTRAQRGDTITFDPNVFNVTNADTATTITLLSPLPSIAQGTLTIDAAGQRVTLNGGGAGSTNGLTIVSDGNTIRGLSLIQFQLSGISVQGANNTLGGDRQTGSGPNGQGLRIGKCQSDGIDIAGAGAITNTVQGCWIGLDQTGNGTQGNVAGVVLENGASNNVIGGQTDSAGNLTGIANYIAANTNEGISVNGVTSINNVIMGNAIGLVPATVTSSALNVLRDDFIGGRSAGNGGAGIFLSFGAQKTIVGGSSSTGNVIGFNKSHGIDVNDSGCQAISVLSNRISRNAKKGINLTAGSNKSIQPPIINEIIFGRSGLGGVTLGLRGLQAVTISGTSPVEGGKVEVFNDLGSQGAVPLASPTIVKNGSWQVAAATYDQSQNVTATVTDAQGNTSEFTVFSGPSAPADPALSLGDADGDGFPDAFEIAYGTNPLDPSSNPTGTAVAAVQSLAAESTSFKAKFTGSTLSLVALTVSGTVQLSAGFKPSGSAVAVFASGAFGKYLLTPKGSGGTGATTFKLSGVKFGKDGTAASTATAKFMAKFTTSGTQAQTFATLTKLANTSTTTLTVPVTVILLINGQLFEGSRNLQCKVKQGTKTVAGK